MMVQEVLVTKQAVEQGCGRAAGRGGNVVNWQTVGEDESFENTNKDIAFHEHVGPSRVANNATILLEHFLLFFPMS